jgi:hypothetical protein
VLRKQRLAIFNWFAAGRLTLMDKEENNMSYTGGGSPYIVGGAGYNGSITLGPSTQGPITSRTLTLRITPANGGSIVSVEDDLYIIGDDADFDRELGKIITMTKLRA